MERESLRVNNERAVLIAVATNQGITPAQLARKTGLGAQTVGRIVELLEASGMVYRGESVRGRRGQPATPILIDPNGAYCIGCEIGWRHLTVLIRDLTGAVLGEHRRNYDFPDSQTIFEEVASLCRLMATAVPEKHRNRILGIGLAAPDGFGRNLDLVGGSEAQAAAWRDTNLAARMEQASGLATFMLNDGNAACWGELVSRTPPRPDNMAYFLISEFVGAGLIADGRLWQGPKGNSANLGSMLVTGRDGVQNFVHRIASINALKLRVAQGGTALQGDPLSWEWEAIEPVASEWIEDGAYAVAKTIINTSAVMEFDIVVVDGVMPRPIVTRFVDRVQEHLAKLPVLTSDKPRVEEGKLGGRAPAMGAALKPLFRRYFSRERDDVAV